MAHLRRALVAALMLAVPCTAQVPSGQPGTFEDYALLELSTEWGRALFRECRLTIALPQGSGSATSRVDCTRNTSGAERFDVAHPFTPEQSVELRRRLRAADLFGARHVGTDTRSADGDLSILTVSDSGSTAALVVSGNPTFATPGPRKDLSDWLMAHRLDLIQSSDEP